MIMARNEDGTYSQVGFVKDNAGIDTEYIYDKDGDIVFEKGFTRETSGTVPLTINGIGKDLKSWSITGKNGTPTPENPVEVQAVGDRTGNLFDNSLLEQGGWKATAGTIPTKLLPGETNYTHRTRYNQIIPLLASTLSLYCPANIKINYVWIDANGISLGGSGYQKNGDTATAPEQAVSMTFILGLDSDIECTPSDFSDINLVAGSIAPESYEPYGYKIPVVTRGKNLWYLQSSYSFTTYYIINVNIKAGHYLSYIIETNGTTGSQGETGCQLTFLDNTTQYFIFNANYRTSIFLSKDVKIVKVYAGKDYSTSVGFTATVSKIMVSANADDSYEPYHEPITTPIYLPTPLYSGEVMRSDGTITRSDGTTETFTAPQILTLNGTTVIDVDTAVKPTEMYAKYKSSK